MCCLASSQKLSHWIPLPLPDMPSPGRKASPPSWFLCKSDWLQPSGPQFNEFSLEASLRNSPNKSHPKRNHRVPYPLVTTKPASHTCSGSFCLWIHPPCDPRWHSVPASLDCEYMWLAAFQFHITRVGFCKFGHLTLFRARDWSIWWMVLDSWSPKI